MARLISVIIVCSALAVAPAGATQQTRPAAGPVVSAYLTGLAEELNELDFQLRHGEISRRDYERARQRLILLRRYVERQAAQSHEDLVPELQILTIDEFGTLALNAKPEPGALRVGARFDERWQLIGIEQPGLRFFVFERIKAEAPAAGERSAPGQASRAVPNLDDVIETVIVPDPAAPKAPNLPVAQAPPKPSAAGAGQDQPSFFPPPQSDTAGPRIHSFFIPVYTPEARARGVEGEVVLSVLFQRNGKVKDVVVERGLGYGLNERAVEAVKKTSFEPARVDGKPVDMRAQLVFTFRLNQVTARVRVGKPGGETKRSLP
jgi:TonB family protein